MPPRDEHDVLGFDRQLRRVDHCEAFSADDVKELVRLPMDVHTSRRSSGHRVSEQLGALRSGARTRLDPGWPLTGQAFALAGFHHPAVLLRQCGGRAKDYDAEQHHEATVDHLAPSITFVPGW